MPRREFEAFQSLQTSSQTSRPRVKRALGDDEEEDEVENEYDFDEDEGHDVNDSPTYSPIRSPIRTRARVASPSAPRTRTRSPGELIFLNF